MTQHTFRSRASRRCSRSSAPRGGFTLLQILGVVGLIALLSAMLVGQFGKARAGARRAECDVHLKEMVMAMSTYRQETGRLPAQLLELNTKGYLPLDAMRCSADPELATRGSNADYSSYSDFYVVRDALDDGELPVIVCAHHEKDGMHGAQGFKGGYTKAFAARPAVLSAIQGAVTVTRGGEGVLAIPASGQLQVRGGDRILMGAGTATLTFADGSYAQLKQGSEMSVLESYMESQDKNSIYTLVRQFAGTVSYSVVPGNKFDVATPTATAGALGTKFTITIIQLYGVPGSMAGSPAPGVNKDARPVTGTATELFVTEHTVAFTCAGRTIEVTQGEPAVRSDDPNNLLRIHSPRVLGGFKTTQTSTAPAPTSPPAPAPTAPPAPVPTSPPAPVPTAPPAPVPTAPPAPVPTAPPAPVPTAPPAPVPTAPPTPLPTTSPVTPPDDGKGKGKGGKDDNSDDGNNGKGNDNKGGKD